ncbi:hypothetical protein BH09GEM1_BH09GEM1_34290 [soil metagenome]
MSILSFPRANFRGVFTCNPVTANNDDVMAALVERDSDSPGIMLSGMTDAQASAYLQESTVMAIDPGAPCKTYIRSGWNLYGDFRTTFDSTVITSMVTGPTAAERVTSAAVDPIIGLPVSLLGSASDDRRGNAMMCDLDATGLVTTQLYIGGLQLGALVMDHDTRAYQNWLNFFSTVGSYGGEQNFVGIGCTFQFAIPASMIPATAGVESPGMTTLLTAARRAQGLTVRFRVFEVEPQNTSETLAAAYANGNGLPNPASGYLIGTIGVWEQGEPETEGVGRKLIPPYPRPQMQCALAPSPAPPMTIPPAPTPWSAGLPPALVGNAVAQVNAAQNVVSVDFAGSFPKNGFRNPDGPQQPNSGGFGAPRYRADMGAIELAVFQPNADPSTAQPIAAIDYGVADYSTYEDFGGIVDLPYSPALAPAMATGILVVSGTAANTLNSKTILLQETPIRVITDDRTLYVVPRTQPESIRLKVYDRGGPATTDTVLYLHEYFNVIIPQFGTCDAPGQEGVRPNQTVAQDERKLMNFTPQVIIPVGLGYTDWFRVLIGFPWSGATILSFQLDPTVFGFDNPPTVTGPQPITGVPTWTYATYTAVRSYAREDFSALYSKGELQWADVYNAALRYYFLLFPAMSTYIQLNDEQSIVANTAIIRQRLHTPDEAGFYSTYNMPATRAMSPAKVKLILDFLDQEEKKQAAPAVVA